MSTVIDLNGLFLEHLKDIYYAEKKILKTLPKLEKAVGKESKLARAFNKHFHETEDQIIRLEAVFEMIGQKPRGKTCEAIDGLTKESEELLKKVKSKPVLEAGLLAGAQAVEHYEIARYGTMIEWARLLGHHGAADLLEETLNEEKTTDQLLTQMATDEVNPKALHAHNSNGASDEDDEDEEEDDEVKHLRRVS